jgi:hypothetical protein
MRALVLLPLLAITGCSLFWSDGEEEGVVCTREFVRHRLVVQLPDGSPAEGARVTATNERTGATYGPCDESEAGGVGCELRFEPGTYVVYTDGQRVSPLGDEVTVRGTRGDRSFEATFRFAAGQCHVEKRAGPDAVTLR